MAKRWILFFLISVRVNIDTVVGLQLGPFTIPSFANGGAAGFSNRLLNASLNPLSQSASLGVQLPQTLNGGFLPSYASLTNVANGFRNRFAARNTFSPIPSVPSATSSASNPSSIQLPNVSSYNNWLRPLSRNNENRLLSPQPAVNGNTTLATHGGPSGSSSIEGFNKPALQIPDAPQGSGAVIHPQLWGNLLLNAASNYSSNSTAHHAQRLDNLGHGLTVAVAQLSNASGPEGAPAGGASGNRKDPHYYPGRTVMVHLFEWKFDDIAEECERVLGPAGYGGVQVSPVNEYVVAPNRPWWERYQPISYAIRSRSGNEQQFADMVRRCQQAGVRIYVDVVANHMAAVGQTVPLHGTAGTPSDPANRLYPGVPYNRTHFHADCTLAGYEYATEVRDCSIGALPDLNQTEPYVRDRIVSFMNRLSKLGVAGFRIDASKHMWPADLEAIYKRLHTLNPMFGFPPNALPFIYQEVVDLGQEPITASQYTDLGQVTEFKYSLNIGLILRGTLGASALQALTSRNASQYGLLPSDSAFVFVDNHDNQRGHGAGGWTILTFKDGSRYVQALAFTLATDYGTVRLMSSYNFTDPGQGPPADALQDILSPGTVTPDGTCSNGWVCEHRWPVVRRMVGFRNFASVAPLTDVQTTAGTFAFCRGNIGFAVFNVGTGTQDGLFRTCLAAGEYCDLISGEKRDTECTGTRVLVNHDGTVGLTLPSNASVVLDLRNRVA